MSLLPSSGASSWRPMRRSCPGRCHAGPGNASGRQASQGSRICGRAPPRPTSRCQHRPCPWPGHTSASRHLPPKLSAQPG
eukprot:724049-Alexandrium_andersonii.AAC.1